MTASRAKLTSHMLDLLRSLAGIGLDHRRFSRSVVRGRSRSRVADVKAQMDVSEQTSSRFVEGAAVGMRCAGVGCVRR